MLFFEIGKNVTLHCYEECVVINTWFERKDKKKNIMLIHDAIMIKGDKIKKIGLCYFGFRLNNIGNFKVI